MQMTPRREKVINCLLYFLFLPACAFRQFDRPSFREKQTPDVCRKFVRSPGVIPTLAMVVAVR
jgi:hypothetical protein